MLYNNQLSGNCWKVRQILALLGIPYERVELDVIDRSNRAEVLGGKNPALRVPTLELDDGEHLAESNAILWYLADGTEYVPDRPLDRARVAPVDVLRAVRGRAEDRRRAVLDLDPRRSGTSTPPSSKRSGAPATARSTRSRAPRRGRDWLVGGAFSVADISVYGYTHVAEEGELRPRALPGVRGVDRPRRRGARACRDRPTRPWRRSRSPSCGATSSRTRATRRASAAPAPQTSPRPSRRLGCVQLDSISTVDRAHRLTLTSRIGAYPERAVSRLLARGPDLRVLGARGLPRPDRGLPAVQAADGGPAATGTGGAASTTTTRR